MCYVRNLYKLLEVVLIRGSDWAGKTSAYDMDDLFPAVDLMISGRFMLLGYPQL